MIGKWKFNNDTIFMHLTVHKGERGLGEPEVPEGMEFVENCMEYGSTNYSNFYYIINENMFIPKSEINDL